MSGQVIVAALVFGTVVACGPASGGEGERDRAFDRLTRQRPAVSEAGIDAVLGYLPTISLAELQRRDPGYVRGAGLDRLARHELKGLVLRIVCPTDRHRFLVGRFRVRRFMSYDPDTGEPDVSQCTYMAIDRRLLTALLELRRELRAAGHDPDRFSVREGYRPPVLNEAVGGAKLSRHVLGEAADLLVGDVNGDGTDNDRDKAIVLDILERRVIGDRGGIGRYPGTMVVHIDVRGQRARWN